jgi:hypothetical protein
MNVQITRLQLSALATFLPAASGAQQDQRLGFNQISTDLDNVTSAHVIRLSVTNFGSGGNTITINADSLAVTLGASAAATVSDGNGIDYDGTTIELGSVYAVGMRIISGPSDLAGVTLSGAAFKLVASNGTFALSAVNADNLIIGSGTWTITGPTGAQSPAWVIEILVFAAEA